jgi:hypothetical protein
MSEALSSIPSTAKKNGEGVRFLYGTSSAILPLNILLEILRYLNSRKKDGKGKPLFVNMVTIDNLRFSKRTKIRY